jgi:hypothetical protein
MLLEAFDAEELGADGLFLVRNDAGGGRTVLIVCRTTSRLRKNHFGTTELRWPVRLGQEENVPAGCSKRSPSKAAASEEAMRTLFGTGSL